MTTRVAPGMKTFLSPARRGRAAATTALAAAVLALSLTGCGNDTTSTAGTAPSEEATPSAPVAPPSSAAPEVETTTQPAPQPASQPTTEPATDDGDQTGPPPSSLGTRDEDLRIDIPGDALFPDGSSASSDGETLTVTTATEEQVSMKLPTSAEGWFHGTTVYLGEAGIGYLITQSGGEYIDTFLAVLDDGQLYVAEPDDEITLGQSVGEGPRFETYTTEAGDHLVTAIEGQGPDGGTEHYEWTVEDRTLVPTLVS